MNHDWLSERAILAGTNKEVTELNWTIQSKIPGIAKYIKFFKIQKKLDFEIFFNISNLVIDFVYILQVM